MLMNINKSIISVTLYGKLRLHSKCSANCPAWHIVWTHAVYQLFRRCGPAVLPSQTFAQSISHSFIESASQIHWFIHAFSPPSVSQQPTQAADWICDTDTDGRAEARLTAHLELLAASWPLDVSILSWPGAVTDSARATEIPYPLSFLI